MPDAVPATRFAPAGELPPRYEPLHRLGAGGSGEVWSIRDRVSGRVLALKVLASGAGDAEIGALVREAVALSGLEGLGVPRVTAFGALRDGRRYMVRELVLGQSLAEVLEGRDAPWIAPIASACDQLTAVHRAGLLHGDVKPANIIVGEGGRGTLVDLGLAAPWRDGGAAAQGLTPKYAAPELLDGEPLTVRAEVYAIGATLGEALARRGRELQDEVRRALFAVVARATEPLPAARWPSVDEFASALRRAGDLPPPSAGLEPPWPVLGLDETADLLLDCLRELAEGGALAIEGPRGAGRTTLARRLGWTLGVADRVVAMVDAAPREAKEGLSAADVIDLELAREGPRARGSAAPPVIIVDDAEALDEAGVDALRRASRSGALLVLVAARAWVEAIHEGPCVPFVVPPMDARAAEALLRRSVPSLPDALRPYLVHRVDGRPGPLRAAVRRLAGRVIVSEEDVAAALAEPGSGSIPPASASRTQAIDDAARALDMGRFDDAARELDALGEARGAAERVRIGLLRARIAVGRGETQGALAELAAIEADALAHKDSARTWRGLRARALLRGGQYAEAARLARMVVDACADDAVAADAWSVRGVALAFTGEDTPAREALDQAVRVARALGEPRAEAVALGSAAIAHQRAGRNAEARAAYEASLAAAEKARDAATVAAMRLNLAGLAQAEGDLALAIAHLEAAVDMGRRSGNGATVTQSLLNLANLELYLGRWARARVSIDLLSARRDELAPAARAQLLGLEAEHATRTGDIARGGILYDETAKAWDEQGRPRDAAESRL
ncbi:MAG: protein kinase, partial [Myxococcales bacterium]|nr:protein kinase [Myxococcales bacterium]